LKEELERLWAEGEPSNEYELCSVFIHRGTSPAWGHYFFYSRDLPENPDQWYKYNDSEISLVRKDEIFADSTGSTANPYLVGGPISSVSSFHC
jgi:ubiquitin carboxyl-terminal hydrolase 25/28